MTARTARLERTTRETAIEIALDLDQAPTRDAIAVSTGLGFLDHLLEAFAFHGGFTLSLTCRGDLVVCDHHTVEDCALALGEAFDLALGDRAGIERFATAFVPMDEALARVALDLSGRPASAVDLGLRRETIGAVAAENLAHFFASLAVSLRAALHVDLLRGENDHHRAEAAFKALGRALAAAVARTGDPARIPSTKGTL